MEQGWYALENDAEPEWTPTSGENARRQFAVFDAEDWGGTHVGYWNGDEWLDVEELGHPTLRQSSNLGRVGRVLIYLIPLSAWAATDFLPDGVSLAALVAWAMLLPSFLEHRD
ncbi:MAG: hypothetical protein ABW128_15465 [Rhizorhabdus sp.]